MTAHARPAQFFFPASLPGFAVGLKLARECEAPSHCAETSALLQLSAIVHQRFGQRRAALELRRLARHLDVKAAAIGRPS